MLNMMNVVLDLPVLRDNLRLMVMNSVMDYRREGLMVLLGTRVVQDGLRKLATQSPASLVLVRRKRRHSSSSSSSSSSSRPDASFARVLVQVHPSKITLSAVE